MQLPILGLSVLILCTEFVLSNKDCGTLSRLCKRLPSWDYVNKFCHRNVQKGTAQCTCIAARWDACWVRLRKIIKTSTPCEQQTCYVSTQIYGVCSIDCDDGHVTVCEKDTGARTPIIIWTVRCICKRKSQCNSGNGSNQATPSSTPTLTVPSTAAAVSKTPEFAVTPDQTSSDVTPAQTSSGVTTDQISSGVTPAQTLSDVTPAQASSGGDQPGSGRGSYTTASNGKTTDVKIMENICPACEDRSGLCVSVPSDGISAEEMKSLLKSLLLDRKTLSKYKRSMISAEDNRLTAKVIGHTGVVLGVVGFVAVVLLDAGRFLNWLAKRKGRRFSFNSP